MKRDIRVRRSAAAICITVCLLLPACASLASETEALMREREWLALEAGPLEAAALPQSGPHITKYFREADNLEPGYRFPGTRLLGTVEADGFRLGIVRLVPPAGPRRGTLIALHGYGGYSAYNLSTLYRLAEDGWSVLAVDLPGHGFSSGPSGDIRDFSDYGLCAAGVIAWLEGQKAVPFPRPLVLLGHSTGGAAVLETLWTHPADVDRAVLLAPLIDANGLDSASALTGCLGKLFPTAPIPASRRGYLSPEVTTYSWVEAFGRWRQGLESRPPLHLPILIVQGDADQRVNWRSNLEILKRLAPDAKVRLLPGRGHVLLDRGVAQAEALAAIREFLADAGGGK